MRKRMCIRVVSQRPELLLESVYHNNFISVVCLSETNCNFITTELSAIFSSENKTMGKDLKPAVQLSSSVQISNNNSRIV